MIQINKRSNSRMYITINNNIRNIRDILVVFTCKKYSFNTKEYNELYGRNVMFNFCTVLFSVLGEKVKQEFSQHNYASIGNGIVYLIFAIFGLSIVSMAIMQSDFNSLKSETHSEQRSANKTVGWQTNYSLVFCRRIVITYK